MQSEAQVTAKTTPAAGVSPATQQRNLDRRRPIVLQKTWSQLALRTGPLPNGDPDALILWGEPCGEERGKE